MVQEKLLQTYNKYSKASRYLIGFTYRNGVYMVDLEQIPKHWVVYRKATKRHDAKLQLRVRNKKFLVNNGFATYLMSVSKWQAIKGYNNGVKFEGYIWRKFKHTYHKDNKPFYESPDITLNGIAYQIKWQNGHLVNIATLNRLIESEQKIKNKK